MSFFTMLQLLVEALIGAPGVILALLIARQYVPRVKRLSFNLLTLFVTVFMILWSVSIWECFKATQGVAYPLAGLIVLVGPLLVRHLQERHLRRLRARVA